MSSWSIEQGEVRDVLAGFNDNSFDALACDPPYGFRFMNKSWDYDVPSVETWRECLRVLKPGAPLVAFGGSRTYHRLACGVEDAEFELRDCLMWLYGKGFPKSQNVGLAIDKSAGSTRQVVGMRTLTGTAAIGGRTGRASVHADGGTSVGAKKDIDVTAPATELAQLWDGYGTALKPAHEPIVLARKPLDGTMAQNVARWGVGGLAIDACRIGANDLHPVTQGMGVRTSWDTRSEPSTYTPNDAGRFPANLALDEEAAALLDAEAGPRPSAPYRENTATGAVLPLSKRTAGGYSDAGGPSRFFYCSKVSTKEREAGCEHMAVRVLNEGAPPGSSGSESPRAGAGRTGGARNHHPTLKPIALTTWLTRLILPPTPGAVLLVPFAGAGSEMIGALKAGWGAVFGVEREAEYIEIARARLAHWCKESEAA